MTILSLSATIGVLSIGMTFVITGGGIDLSVGAVMALASVWATTVSTQVLANDTHWMLLVVVAILVGAVCGLLNGIMVSFGKIEIGRASCRERVESIVMDWSGRCRD